MSGHSKWANIKHKKEAADRQKGKMFSRVGKEIMVAAKNGGPDPNTNPALRAALTAAKAVNMPNANIDRAIKKGIGELGDVVFEEIIYEGYGPCGVAVVVETLTDNRNRTAADLRHYFDKCGGNLGQTGCVSFMFNQKGKLIIEAEGLDEDQVMEDALEAGATDFEADEDVFDISTEPEDFSAVRDALEGKGYAFVTAEIQMVPDVLSAIDDPDAIKNMDKLLDMLEDNDDVQNVWHNWDRPDED